MNSIVEQTISNHPLFPDVQRTVVVDSFQPVASRTEFNIIFSVRYEKNGADITDSIKQPESNVINANNNMRIELRDAQFNPIPNPNWNGQDEATRYQTMPGYDYVAQYFNQPISIADFIKAYIQVNDADGFFN
jgi:hypothetical protein